ncbi:MAG TPA: dTDP-4-dehydrorhamnose 3,5-epimerase [Candidatus Acidoferrales bacterium]|nr:dTDP-4-dehydrorhamnose 3,5-epimerase [Candidatus Acidoferrales bacterium]
MRFVPTELSGVVIIEPDVYRDSRGFFLESYQAAKYEAAGVVGPFVQDNHSSSVRHTLRGLHAQLKRPQGKLVRAVAGEIFDVAVDIRRGSPTYLRWTSVVLSAENFRQLWVPTGFAHGFCVLSAHAEVEYKCTDYYDPVSELRLLWNEPAIGIPWPTNEPLLSDKDLHGSPLSQVEAEFPLFAGA